MAKMFYSLEETAQKLGVAPSQVRDMVTQGRLQEFRDRDKLMFKVEQVELLSGHEESGGSSMIPLADAGGSGSGIPVIKEDSGGSGSGGGSGSLVLEENPKERSGISIFDTEQLEEADPSAVTQVTGGGGGAGEGTMESVGSGSGLLDLTREGDDTSLGADLLEGVGSHAGDGAVSETAGTSGLFETTGAASDVSGGMVPAGALMIAPEAFEPAWSGFGGGLALGVVAVAAVALCVAILGITGAVGSPLLKSITGSWPTMWLGASAGAVVVLAIIGWLIGRRG
jgi:hypothetical protein